MHAACMENIPNPCMLHACRYKCNLHVTCTKVNACFHLNYACNMHVTCARVRIGWGEGWILYQLLGNEMLYGTIFNLFVSWGKGYYVIYDFIY